MIFFIKNLGIILCCIFYYTKLLHLQLPRHFAIHSSIFSVLLSLFSIVIELHYTYCTIPILIIMTAIFFTHHFKTALTISITTTTIAFAFSYITLFLSSTVIATFFVEFFNKTIFVQLLSCLVQITIMHLPFKIKRFRNGMPFLHKKLYAFPGMIISLYILLIITASTYAKNNHLKNDLLIALILLCLFTLNIYYYWQTNITKAYQDKLKDREINELQEQNEKLKEEVMRLGKIVHKDNSILSEYAYILHSCLTGNATQEKDISCDTKRLLEKLEQLTKERKNIVLQQDIHCHKLPPTKVYGIDSLLEYKQQLAFKDNIDLQVCFACDVTYLANEVVTEDDMHTLLTYLLDNAIIATKHNNGHLIMLTISNTEDTYCISVLDSGIPFTTDVIAKWGLEQITTHTNGNGIGMMTVYEILKKYSASFIIDEIPSVNRIYTKKLTISFDQKNQYILHTTRTDAELSKLSFRTDLTILKE